MLLLDLLLSKAGYFVEIGQMWPWEVGQECKPRLQYHKFKAESVDVLSYHGYIRFLLNGPLLDSH